MNLSSRIQRALKGRRATKRKHTLIEQTRASLARRKRELQLELDQLASRFDEAVEEMEVRRNALLEIADEENDLERQLDQSCKRQRILQDEVEAVLDAVFVDCRLLTSAEEEEQQELEEGKEEDEEEQEREKQEEETEEEEQDGATSQHSEVPVVLDTSLPSPQELQDPIAYLQVHGTPPRNISNFRRLPWKDQIALKRAGYDSIAHLRVPKSDIGTSNPLTPQEARKVAARHMLGQTHDALMTAQAEFDMREERCNQHLQVYELEVARGAPVPPKTEIDHMHVRYGRRLTRKLMEAEAAYENAKREAQAAGLRIGWHQESNFVDDPDDGYRESLEREAAAASIDRSQIEKWLENVPAADYDDTSEVDVDEWDARLDEPLDSVSVLAQGAYRRRIDQWQTSTEQIRRDAVASLGDGGKPAEGK